MAVAVSVVVAVYGVSAYLCDCLDSLLLGVPDEVEIIAVDDASPDTCGEILDGYAPRVRVLHLPRNVGLGGARNAGLDAATGEYVWFVDGDDVVPPGGVAAVVNRLRRTDPDVLLLGHGYLPDSGEQVRLSRSRSVALLTTRQAAWNRVVRRSLITGNDLRFPNGWYEDVAYSHLVILAAGRIDALDRVCYFYRQRPGGTITSTTSPRHFEIFDQYELLFATLTRWRVGERMRARVFARMIEHYLVVVGAKDRLPDELRAAFFRRMVEHYRRYRPNIGYPLPTGINAMKHRFVRWDAYRVFSALRGVYRAASRDAGRQPGRPAVMVRSEER